MPLFKRERQQPKRFRCFFATDIHGSDRCFRKFLAAVTVYEADALILGGDIAGKAIVPIVSNGNGRRRVEFHGSSETVSKEELQGLIDRIRFNGLYPYECGPEEHQRLGSDSAFKEELFERLIMDQVRGWRELAAERLPDQVRCIITPGNDDPPAIDVALEAEGRTECPERRTVTLGPVQFASLGNTNRTPWNTDREYEEEELVGQIDDMLASADASKPLVFNFHCPPFDSELDTVTKLDENLKPVVERGTPVQVSVGSTAVRQAIERYQPVVGLHGHIHECHGVQRIGSTVCINPGSEYGTGYLKGAIVVFDEDGNYLGHLLTSG